MSRQPSVLLICYGLFFSALVFAEQPADDPVASPDKERAASAELYNDTSIVRIFQVNLLTGWMRLEAMVEEENTVAAPTLTWLDARTLRIAYKRQWPLADPFDEVWIGKLGTEAGWRFERIEQ